LLACLKRSAAPKETQSVLRAGGIAKPVRFFEAALGSARYSVTDSAGQTPWQEQAL